MLYALYGVPKLIGDLLTRLTSVRAGYLDNLNNINTKINTIDTRTNGLNSTRNAKLDNLDAAISTIPTSLISTIIKEDIGGETSYINTTNFTLDGGPPFGGTWRYIDVTMGSSVTNLAKSIIIPQVFATAVDSDDTEFGTDAPLKECHNGGFSVQLPVRLTAVNNLRVYASSNLIAQSGGGLRKITSTSTTVDGEFIWVGTVHVIEFK